MTGEISIRVRYSECDPMNVAHHSAYPVWLEMGRTELLRSSGVTYRDLEDIGILLAVVTLSVRYHKPAKYDDVLQLRTTLRNVGHVKIEHDYELFRDGVRLAIGSTTLGCIDRDGRLQPVPDVIRNTS